MNLANNWIGLIHVIAAITALICGTLVLGLNKGTLAHKRIGYIYSVNILIVVISAFGIYRLFKGFGPFHAFAVISIISLFLGMIPMLKRKRTEKAIKMHYSRMYWSVIGLYAAFAAETLVRIPSTPFWSIVVLSISVIIGVGALFFRKYVKSWKNKFVIESNKPIHTANN